MPGEGLVHSIEVDVCVIAPGSLCLEWSAHKKIIILMCCYVVRVYMMPE